MNRKGCTYMYSRHPLWNIVPVAQEVSPRNYEPNASAIFSVKIFYSFSVAEEFFYTICIFEFIVEVKPMENGLSLRLETYKSAVNVCIYLYISAVL